MLSILTKRFGQRHVTKIAVIAVTVLLTASLLITFLFSLLPSDIRTPDMTANRMYTLSNGTKDTLKDLNKEVQLYLLAYDTDIDQSIKVFMERYACENKNVKFKVLDPQRDVYEISEYLSEAPAPNSILAVCGDKFRYIDYYELFSFSAESYQLAYQYYYQACQYNPNLASQIDIRTYAVMMGLYDEFVYESKITSAIKYVTAENTEKIYVLSGHGEGKVTYDLISRAGNDCIDFNVHDANTLAIPTDAECVFLVCTTDLTENEVAHLSEFMERGGKLVTLTGLGYNVPNFYALAKKYGLTSENKYVCDDTEGANYSNNPHALIPQSVSGNIKNVLDASDASLLLPYCAPIKISDALPEGIIVNPLISTSANAYVKPVSATSTEFNEATDTREVRHIGVEATNSNGGGIIWFSSLALIIDEYDVFSLFGNKLVMIDVFNDATDNALRNNIASVSRAASPLDVPMSLTVTFMVIFCGIIPAGLIALCVIRRKRLYSMK